jgi:hypothetical protein
MEHPKEDAIWNMPSERLSQLNLSVVYRYSIELWRATAIMRLSWSSRSPSSSGIIPRVPPRAPNRRSASRISIVRWLDDRGPRVRTAAFCTHYLPFAASASGLSTSKRVKNKNYTTGSVFNAL